MIRYLEKEEKGRCRGLWQEAFPEDSEGFLEYYFKWKTRDNQILVKEDETGRILSMAHLNPYQVMVRGRVWELDYIVGVATAKDSRHQGHMRDILGKMLLDMHEAGMPFCYLMPASEAIYLLGFRFVFDQPLWQMKEGLPEGAGPKEIPLAEAHSLASWINRWLKQRFQVYALRDEKYMERLEAELDSENGRVFGWYDKQGELKASGLLGNGKGGAEVSLFCGTGLGGTGRRGSNPGGGALQTGPADESPDGAVGTGCNCASVRPAIMARITDAARMMEAVSLNEEAPCDHIEALLRIRDELIPGNRGLWRWKLDAHGSRLMREPAGPAGEPLFSTEVLDIDAAVLAPWLFGYDTLEHLMKKMEKSRRLVVQVCTAPWEFVSGRDCIERV